MFHLIPFLQAPEQPQDLLTFQWIVIVALVGALGYVVRQYIVNERQWRKREDKIRSEYIERYDKHLERTAIAIEKLSEAINAANEEIKGFGTLIDITNEMRKMTQAVLSESKGGKGGRSSF